MASLDDLLNTADSDFDEDTLRGGDHWSALDNILEELAEVDELTKVETHDPLEELASLRVELVPAEDTFDLSSLRKEIATRTADVNRKAVELRAKWVSIDENERKEIEAQLGQLTKFFNKARDSKLKLNEMKRASLINFEKIEHALREVDARIVEKMPHVEESKRKLLILDEKRKKYESDDVYWTKRMEATSQLTENRESLEDRLGLLLEYEEHLDIQLTELNGELAVLPERVNKRASLIQTMCMICDSAGVSTEMLSVAGSHAHKSCLACSVCNADVSSVTFELREKKIYCGTCSSSGTCQACNKPIMTGEMFMLDDKKYHAACFQCSICFKPLSADMTLASHEGKPCCAEHVLTKCSVCADFISGKYMQVGGKDYHLECFTCITCSANLAGQRYGVKEDRAYCAACYSK